MSRGSAAPLMRGAVSLLVLALITGCARAPRERASEARVGAPTFDVYKPYRAAVIATLPVAATDREERGDVEGAAAACLSAGHVACARRLLPRAPAGVATEIDRGVVALADGRAEEALERFDAALTDAPRSGAARFDRALALAKLELPLAAAEAFDDAAALGEPGWSQEARDRAARARAAVAAHQRAWKETVAAGNALMLEGALPPDAIVSAQPLALRYWFNHALRAADSRERVLALSSLAARLDAAAGGHVLADAVRSCAAADFGVRAPLARRYRRWLTRASTATPAAEAKHILEELRLSGQRDLYVAGFPMLGRMRADLDAFAAAARALGDPWYQALADEEAAAASADHGDPRNAERILVAAHAACIAAHVDYRCVAVAVALAELLHGEHRTAEAARVALDGLSRARRHAPLYETKLIFELADIARYRNAFSLMRAYLREGELRSGEDCQSRRYAHELRASERRFALDGAAARAELSQAPRCDRPITPARADLLADLERMGEPLPEAATLVDDVAAARPALSAGNRATVDVAAARWLAVHDAQAARPRLQAALAEAEAAGGVDGEKARTMALLSLAMEAARRADWPDVLDSLSRWSGGAATGCVVAVAVDAERALVSVRTADGKTVGRFVARRPSPALVPTALVPDELISGVRGCDSVDVLALPPVHGMPRLLPADVAWAYRVGAHAAAASTSPLRVVVSGVDAPPRLGLPRLAPWRPTPSAGQIWLTGAAATPERVLSQLTRATEVLFHVHGLVDLGLSDASLLVLSAGDDGEFALTAGRVARAHLAGRPIVVLGACDAAQIAPYLHEPWGLPLAFIRAGARAVIASPTALPDAEAGPLFDAILGRIRGGQAPAAALRDERMKRRDASEWTDQLLLFD